MKILVMGYGSIGRRHAGLLASRADVSICEPDVEKRQMAQSDGISLAFAEASSALAWQPEAIVIAVPTHLHASTYRSVQSAQVPVLIEKPIAHDSEDLAFFRSCAHENSAPLFVMANMRCHTGPQLLAKNLHRVGQSIHASAQFGSYLPAMRPNTDYRSVYAAHRNQGGGVLFDCIHELDYLWWLFGKPKVVAGHLTRLSELEINVEDHAVVLFDHNSGLRSLVEMDYLQRHKFRGCRVVGTEGTLVWQSRFKAPESVGVSFYAPDQREPEIILDTDSYDANVCYETYLEAFLAEVIEGAGARHNQTLLDLGTAVEEVALLQQIIADNGPLERKV